jgi:hypothetical protein
MQTRIYCNKYVTGSVHSEGHLKKNKKTGMTIIQALIYPFMLSKAQSSLWDSPFKNQQKLFFSNRTEK